MRKTVLAALLALAVAVPAHAQPPGVQPAELQPGVIPTVTGPVLVVCLPIGVRIQCETCWNKDGAPGSMYYYSGGNSAYWMVKVGPMYVVEAPLWVHIIFQDDSTSIAFETEVNRTGAFRSGVIKIGNESFLIYQEAL